MNEYYIYKSDALNK